MKKFILVLFLVLLSCQEMKEANNPTVKGMWQGTVDPYKKPLPSINKISELMTGNTDEDLKVLLQIVQGSMPVYAPGFEYSSSEEIMTSPRGDCEKLTHRFVIIAKQLGYEAVGRNILNYYIPGHVFADVNFEGMRYLVDINHGVIVKLEGNKYKISYTPHKIPYYLPANVFTDWWGDTASLDLWIREIRNERWPGWLATGTAIDEINKSPILEFNE